jgi:hypothetical protein
VRDSNLQATGQVLFDDGVSFQTPAKDNFALWTLSVIDIKTIKVELADGLKTYVPPGYMAHIVDKIVIMNAGDLSAVFTACYFGAGTVPTELTADYNGDYKELHLKFRTNVAINDIGTIKFIDDKGTECTPS